MRLLVLSAAVTAACSSPAETAIRVEVAYDDSWDVSGFALAIAVDGEAPREELVDAAGELLLLVPDVWADRVVTIDLDGLRGSQRWAHGVGQATPVRGGVVDATVVLTLLPCGAWCTEGAMQCEQGGVSICEQRDADACLEWSDPLACPEDAPFCSLGVCDATCIDECAAGETRCEGTDALRGCGQAEGDPDECLDWLPAVACGTGEVCSADQCNTSCSDECVDGTIACSGAGTHTCGDLDANDCLEWGPVVPCEDGESCSGNACAAGCSDDCTIAACDDDSFVDCGQYDLDDCLDWSPGTSCAAADPCSAGACTADGCISTPLVCEDPPEPVCVTGGTTARTYAPVGICGDGVCDYAFTDELCPGGCLDGACVCAEATCAVVNVATKRDYVYGMAVDDTDIYWTTDDIFNGDTVMRRSKALGAAVAETVATGQDLPVGVALDDTHVYWANFSGDIVMRRSKTLGAVAVETVATGQDGAIGVALDDTHVYWTAKAGDTVRRRLKSLGAAVAETVATGQVGAQGVALDDTHVYWTTFESDTVMRRSKTLGAAAVETVATGQGGAQGVVVDDTHVYWTCQTADGTVMRRSKALGAAAVETLATGQDGASYLAVDATHLYWNTYFGSSVSRLSRCACDL